MRERGRYQLQLMKTRNSSGVGQKIDLGFNLDTLRIEDLGEEDDDSGYGSAPAPGSSVLANIKRGGAATNEVKRKPGRWSTNWQSTCRNR